MTYRKIGGIHWIAIGRLRISICLVRKRKPMARPTVEELRRVCA